jgi:predicted phosphodiesterase
MAKALKLVAFSCTHHPLHDESAIDWLLGLIRRERPNVVAHLGDGIESNASSQWPDAMELGLDLADEFTSLNGFLADVRKAAPKGATLKYLPGNHEENILRAGRVDKRLRKLVDWRRPENIKEMANWEVGRSYNYSRRLGCSWLGPVCLSHGYETTPTQASTEAIYFTRNWPNSLYIAGHTHRPVQVTQIEFKGGLALPHHYANVGCLRNLDPGYMERKRKWGWGQGAFVGEFMPLKSPRLSREWDGRVEVHRMYDEAA